MSLETGHPSIYDSPALPAVHYERQARTILDSIAEGVYGVDRDGRATFVNPAAGRLLGWAPEELVGRSTHELVHHSHPDGTPYPKADCTMYHALREGAVRHVDDEVFWRKDGSSFPVAYTTTPVWEGGTVVGAVVTFHDISERIAAQQKLISSEKRFRTLTDNAPVGIFQTDPAGRCEFVNDRWAEIAGVPRSEARGRWADVLHPDDRERVLADWRTTIATGVGSSSEHRLRGRDGAPDVWVIRQTVALRDEQGRVTGFIGTVTDVTAHREAHEQARTDALTGLPNRRAFLEELDREVTRRRRHGRPLALVLMDLDNFKRVNDLHGHPVGDRVLCETARRLGAVVRAGETLGRLGGEEFAWLLPDTTSAGARDAAERGRRAVAGAAFPVAGAQTVSAGLSVLTHGDDDAEDLLRRADEALYRAKAAGRNTVAD
ncbi:MAG: diguanylate cyclase [Actinomycetota bacterium]